MNDLLENMKLFIMQVDLLSRSLRMTKDDNNEIS